LVLLLSIYGFLGVPDDGKKENVKNKNDGSQSTTQKTKD
jgi:hypothetical protein